MYGLIVFLSGMTVMMLEITGIRTLTPFFGMSFTASTSMIGVILFSLSIGYWLGGKLADKLQSLKSLSMYIFFAGIYCLITSFIEFDFLYFMNNIPGINLIWATVIASILLYCVPSIILAFVSPWIIKKALSVNKCAGNIIGSLYAQSALGSIIGTFLCGYCLILYFGVDVISFVITFIIFVVSLLIFLAEKPYTNKFIQLIVCIMFVTISLFSIFYYKICPRQICKDAIYAITSAYEYWTVREFNGMRYLHNSEVVPRGFASRITLNDSFIKNLYSYHLFFFTAFCEKLKKENILILGNGSGVFLSALNEFKETQPKKFNVDVVEIDKSLDYIAKKYFKMKVNDTTHFYFEDARTFVNRKAHAGKNKYDIIFLDVFTGGSYLSPYHLLTKENIKNIYQILSPDGIFMMNVIGGINGSIKKNLSQTYTQVLSSFSDVVVYRKSPHLSNPNREADNFILVAYKDPDCEDTIKIKKYYAQQIYENIEKSNELYTDKYMPYEKILLSKS